MKKNSRYSKEDVERWAILSKRKGRINEQLGLFILERCNEIGRSAFNTNGNAELLQALIDDATMRCCEEFLERYVEGLSAANLIISMIYSSMYNKIKSLNWKDIYGEKRKTKMMIQTPTGWEMRLIKMHRDENLSADL